MAGDGEPTVRLVRWTGPWEPDDPDAAYKAEVARAALVDPTATLEALGAAVGVPPGAIARHVLARWAAEGSAGLLELGPSMVERLWRLVAEAEAAGDDAARLAAYHRLRGLIGWLHAPIAGDPGPPG